jgi:DNA-binding transcriptional LysR family regulator
VEPVSHDRLAGISAFVAAVEAGSFAQAAARLRLTRSAVGKSIARLEARLGSRLFVRTTRSQSLTDDGQVFYERCARALEELNAAQHILEAGRDEPVGRIRVSAPVVFGRLHVTPVLLSLAKRYPRLQLEGIFTDRLVDFVDDGIDLAIRSGLLADSDAIVARRLGEQRMILCASPAYLESNGTPRDLADLTAHRGINYMRGGRIFPWPLTDATGRKVETEIAHRIGFDDIGAIAAAAVDGAGLAHVPYWLVNEHLQSGALVGVLGEASSVMVPLHAIWPRTRYLPYKLRVVIDTLLDAIPPSLQPANKLADPAYSP